MSISKIPNCITTWANATLKRVTSATPLTERTALQALQDLNQYTLELYAGQKAKVRAQLGQKIPVILANQNLLVSKYRGIRRGIEYIPQQYHVLKALAHIPIAIHTARQMEDTQESERLFVKLEGLFRPYQEDSNAA